jgi:micrococcal nuclease
MKNFRWILLIIIFAILVFFSIIILKQYKPENKEVSNNTGINNNTVMEIIDGDTFKMENGDTIRLICVDSPEKGKEGYEEAKEFLSFLISDKEIRMEKDVSDKDNYGRLLRYIYVNDSDNNNTEIFVNKEIVSQGYATVFIYGNDTSKCGEIEGS